MNHNLPKPGFLRAANHHPLPQGLINRCAASALPWIATALCMVSQAHAQTASPSPASALSGTSSPTLLQEVVVTATRMEESAAHVTAAYTKIGEDEIDRTQTIDVKKAVTLSPGVVTWTTGADGDQAAISIRGNRSTDTLMLVDGITAKSNITNGSPRSVDFLSTYNLESLEIIRGPYSTLYGSNAIGGVVALQTKRGSGDPKAMTFFEGGSFNTFREGILSDGSIGALDYSLHYAREDTSNDRPNNDLANNSGSLRLDWTVNDRLTVGVITRTQAATYGTPGPDNPLAWGSRDPNANVSADFTTLATYAELKATDFWTSKLTLGGYKERYHMIDPANPGDLFPEDHFDLMEASNLTADWQNTFQLTDCNKLLVGTTLLYQTGHEESFWGTPFSLHRGETNIGVYAEDQWEVIKNLTLTAGVRLDHYEFSGDPVTYHLGAAYLVEQTHTKLRATCGTAFREAAFYESSSTLAYNGKNLAPEHSQSWDIGFDQYLCNDRVSIGAAYFNSETRNTITYVGTGFPSYIPFFENRNRKESHGIETSAVVKLTDCWNARLNYTWTESDISPSDGVGMIRYQRVPRHMVSADTNYTLSLPKGKLTLGGGLVFLAQREDIDAVTWGQVDMPDYAVGRVYGRYEYNDHVAFTARVENIANKKYESCNGYPALGRGIYGGLEVRF